MFMTCIQITGLHKQTFLIKITTNNVSQTGCQQGRDIRLLDEILLKTITGSQSLGCSMYVHSHIRRGNTVIELFNNPVL